MHRQLDATPNAPSSSSVVPPVPANPPASHQCPICWKYFTTAMGLAMHQKDKGHNPQPSECPKTSSASQGQENHQSVHPSVSPFLSPFLSPPSLRQSPQPGRTPTPRCNQCGECFDSYAKLENHISISHKFPCSKCEHKFSSLFEWNRHFNEEHLFKCNTCRSTFPSAPALRLHKNECPVIADAHQTALLPSPPPLPVRIACPHCQKTFKNSQSLHDHNEAKHSSASSCVLCHFKGPPDKLQEHVNKNHCCPYCDDGIIRDTKTLQEHVFEHSHPYRCKTCGTKHQSEEDLFAHFASPDSYHPVCAICHIGFENQALLISHMDQAHPSSPEPALHTFPHTTHSLPSQPVLGPHLAEVPAIAFECGICSEPFSSQLDLAEHTSMDHSCPVCHEGFYIDPQALEDHLEDHRAPHRCVPCGTRYRDEGLLHQHYKTSSDDVHPTCVKCDVAFRNQDEYSIHLREIHPLRPCELCGGEPFDPNDLLTHYLSSNKHPKCRLCHVGFKNNTEYADHGVAEHPESHCYLCRWQFDSPDVLLNHINHFYNHPKCGGCDLRFPDVEAYQQHLVAVHCPTDNGIEGPTTSPARTSIDHIRLLSSLGSSPTVSATCQSDPQGNRSLIHASLLPLPASRSGVSTPASRKAISEASFQQSKADQSSSYTLTFDHLFPQVAERQFGPLPLTIGVDGHAKGYPNVDHSPLSMVPNVGAPVLLTQSFDPCDPRRPPQTESPESHSSRRVIDTRNSSPFLGHEDDSSSFAPSPQLISPVVELPSPAGVSPTLSNCSSDKASVANLSFRSPIPSGVVAADVSNCDRSRPPGYCPPGLHTLQVSRGIKSVRVPPSSIPYQSAGIPTSATSQSFSPPLLQSTVDPSPILSSTGLALGEGEQHREVRFDANIMSEPIWDRESTSSSCSFDSIVPRMRNGIHMQKRASKLPRFTSLQRKSAGNKPNQAIPVTRNFKAPSAPSYHCRVCLKDPCDRLTTTTCGHLFCYGCISNVVMENSHCPVCNIPTLLYCLFRIDLSP